MKEKVNLLKLLPRTFLPCEIVISIKTRTVSFSLFQPLKTLAWRVTKQFTQVPILNLAKFWVLALKHVSMYRFSSILNAAFRKKNISQELDLSKMQILMGAWLDLSGFHFIPKFSVGYLIAQSNKGSCKP